MCEERGDARDHGRCEVEGQCDGEERQWGVATGSGSGEWQRGNQVKSCGDGTSNVSFSVVNAFHISRWFRLHRWSLSRQYVLIGTGNSPLAMCAGGGVYVYLHNKQQRRRRRHQHANGARGAYACDGCRLSE